jgi:hypothetical protein
MRDVDAAAVGDGMTRSVVRRPYLRLRARPTGIGLLGPVATRLKCAVSAEARPAATQFWPCCFARHVTVNAQFRSRLTVTRRSFGRGAVGGGAVLALLFRPPRGGKCAVSPSRDAVSAEARAAQFRP